MDQGKGVVRGINVRGKRQLRRISRCGDMF